MKKSLTILLVLVAAAAIMLSACDPAVTPTPVITDPPTETAEAEAPTEQNVPEETEPAEDPTGEADPTEDPSEDPTATSVPTANPYYAPGTNVALTAEVEVSTTTGESHVQWGWSYEYVNDGIIMDRDELSYGWTSEVLVKYDSPETDDWALFELSDYTAINSVKIWPIFSGTNFPVDYHVEVSLDGREFTTVASVEGDDHASTGNEEPVLLEFPTVTAKYVKFAITRMHDVQSGNDGYIFQIAEIEIFAK
ncbi:MAG: discoidin domain-containing protein [Clostridia bacterium]|nr:discoidin domain-containing protein [Clostridia bacterium]